MALRNWEIVVYALHLLEGAARHVHTEDIALRCFELAPGSFSWIKHQEFPDKDIVRVSLVDARKEKMGGLVSGRAGKGKGQLRESDQHRSQDGWQLTESGIRWIKANEERLARVLEQHEPKAHRQEVLQRLSRLREHDLFRDFLDRRDSFVPSIGHLAELLRCRVDADPSVWNKRFEALRKDALVAKQQDMIEFIETCQKHVAPTTRSGHE